MFIGGFIVRIKIEDGNDDDVIELLKSGKINSNYNVNSKNVIDVAYDDTAQLEDESEVNEVKGDIKGEIIVYSRLGNPNGPHISSAKINLYMINGISPKLICSKLTDSEGKVVFDNLEMGSYRVISIVDRKYFEKPTYINWNEVTIDSNLNKETITVINRIKYSPSK